MRKPDGYCLWHPEKGFNDPNGLGDGPELVESADDYTTGITETGKKAGWVAKPVCLVDPALLDWVEKVRHSIHGFDALKKDLPLSIVSDMLRELEQILPKEK